MIRYSGMKRRISNASSVLAALCLFAQCWAVPSPARAQQQPPKPAAGERQPVTPDQVIASVGIDQKLNSQVPLDAPFTDQEGRPVTLGQYFGKKPIVLALVYYRCPSLCNLMLEGVVNSVRNVEFTTGKEYDLVVVSIDPNETTALAQAKRQEYLELYARSGADRGWHFLTGPQESITPLAKSVGFRYLYDPATTQFAHASGIMVLTPEGKVARYLMGVEYPPKFLRMALVEASQGKIATPADKLNLFCYEYDPATGKYRSVIIMRAMQVAGTLTALGLGTFMLAMFRRERSARPGVGTVGGRSAGV